MLAVLWRSGEGAENGADWAERPSADGAHVINEASATATVIARGFLSTMRRPSTWLAAWRFLAGYPVNFGGW